MYISRYEDKLRELVDREIKDLEDPENALLKKFFDLLHERIVQRLHDDMKDYFMSNLRDDLCREASRLAEQHIESALAGDDEQIKNLFGFRDYYKQRPIYEGKFPHQWELINAIAVKNPELFVNEKIEQQAGCIEQLKADLARKLQYCENNHVRREDGLPI